MVLTVRNALDLEVFQGIKPIAGLENLNNEIRWVHIGESINMAEWLKGGELLLTCAHGIKNNSGYQLKFLEDLSNKKIAAVGIEAGYYFKKIPILMRRAADRLNLPLLEIPKGRPFIEITEVIIDRIIKEEKKRFEKDKSDFLILEIENKLFNAIKHGFIDEANEILKDIISKIEENDCKYNGYKHYNRAVYETIKFIENNYNQKLSLEEVANSVFLSASYLSKLFKDEIDKTIIEFLTEVRIEKAKKFLITSELSLQSIAEKVGYGDASYFSKVFKKEEGISPSEYRKR